MKKVVYSVTKVGRNENTKMTGLGYITNKDLIIACISKNGKLYIRVFEDCVNESFTTLNLYNVLNIVSSNALPKLSFIAFSNISSVQDYKIIEELQHNVTAKQESVHDFYLPISAPVYDIPSIEVKVNETAIETELLI